MSMNTWEHVLASGGTEEVTLEGVMESGSLRTLDNDPESVGTPAPPPPPPPPSGVRRLGMYSGNFTDEAVHTSFGHYPGISTTYYAPGATGSPSVNISRESTKINLGVSPLITISTANTQRLVGIAGNADSGTNTADRAWLDTYLDSLDAISKVDLDVPVYAVLDHEFDHGVAVNSYTGTAASFTNYGQALTYFYNRARTRCPLVQVGYWNAGAIDRRADNVAILSAINAGFDWIATDPYAQSGTNPSTTWAQRLNDFRTGIYATQYARLNGLAGKTIPLNIAETGINKGTTSLKNSDATMAGWISNLPTAMETSDVGWVIYFNRDSGSNGDWQIDGGTYQPRPLSKAAMGTAFQTVNGR